MSCPERIALEECAGGVPLSPVLRAHLNSCPACAQLVEQIEAENTFLRKVAGVAEVTHPAASSPDRTASFELPGYTIVRQLHRGGQGVVYHAIQESTQRDVAIKVMREGLFAGVSDRARFEREVQLLAQLDHPNIVTIYDSGISGGYCYFVMDLIEGVPLDQWLRQSAAASVRDRAALFALICEAVNAAHIRGVIHRDLKPGNILIVVDQSRGSSGASPSGSGANEAHSAGPSPKILDFGLAKETIVDESRSDMTITGQFLGTPAWASPEQAAGDPAGVDMRSDVYTLGVILFVMLTGQHPYPVSRNLREMMDRIQTVEPPPPSQLAATVDHEMDTITLKCLSKHRERRYQSAGELGRDVRRYLAKEPIEAKRDSALYVLGKVVARYRGFVWLVSGFGLVLLALSVSLWVLHGKEAEQRSAAQRAALRAQSEGDRAREAERRERARADEAEALRRSSAIESGRALAQSDNMTAAERILWREFLNSASGPSPNSWKFGNREFWALAQLHVLHPCEATLALPAPADRFSMLWLTDEELLVARSDRSVLTLGTDRLDIRRTIRHQNAMPETVLSSVTLTPGGRHVVYSSPAGVQACRTDNSEWSTRFERPADARDWNTMTSGEDCIAYLTAAGEVKFIDITAAGFVPRSASLDVSGIIPRYIQLLEDGVSIWFRGDHRSHLVTNYSEAPLPFEGEAAGGASLAPGCCLVYGSHGRLRYWNANDPPEAIRSTSQVHVGSIGLVKLAPTGTRTVSLDNTSATIRVWALPELAETTRLYGHTSSNIRVSFRPDATSLISGCGDGLIRRWALPGNDPITRIASLGGTVIAGAFSRDGSRVFVGAQARFYSGDCYSFAQLTEPTSLRRSEIGSIEMSPDGRALAITYYDGVVCLHDPTTLAILDQRARVRKPTDHEGQLKFHDVSFHPSGDWLVVAADDGAVYCWNLRDGAWTALPDHGQAVPSAEFSADGRWLASSDRNGDAILWSIPGFTVRARWRAGEQQTRAVAFCRNDRVLAAGDDASTVRLWDVESQKLITQLDGHSARIFALAAQPGGSLLASGDASGLLILWDATSGAELMRFREHTSAVFSIAFSPDGRYMLSTGSDKRAVLRDLAALERRVARNAEAAITRFGESTLTERRTAVQAWVETTTSMER